MRFCKLTLILCLAIPTLSANADEIAPLGLEPLSNEVLSQYRGGFQVVDDYIINIGLSITTAINGENLLKTTIANLVIENGNLTNVDAWNDASDLAQNPLDQGIVNIIQFGEGNIIGDSSSSNMPDMPPIQTPNIVSSEVINTSIINIIQNTTDNSVIGLSTLVDIDAQVSGVLQQIRSNQRLEDALLNHFP